MDMHKSPGLWPAIAAVLLTIALDPPRPAVAQDWPSPQITMVVPLSAGGGLDAVGRIIAAGLGPVLGQHVVVENVTGAGGMIGSARVANAPADGYQVLLGSVGTHAQNQTLYKRPL
jgi:tripartite-type tricarboxylate transporter receptor subunit TctC